MGLMLVAVPGVAGAQMREPIGPAAADIRVMTTSMPTLEGWTPTLPIDGEVPGRSLGLQAGGHVYFGQWGAARFGAGAVYGWARGTAIPKAEALAPEVRTRVETFSPQLSLNFGHKLGYSYLSAGYGAGKVISESTALGTTPAAIAESGWVGALNVGGGARWFVTEHLGVGLDLRWHKLGSFDPAAGGATVPGTTLFQFGVGLTIR